VGTVLVALRVNTDRRDQDQILLHVNAVNLDHQQVEAARSDAIHSFIRAADSATKATGGRPISTDQPRQAPERRLRVHVVEGPKNDIARSASMPAN
jgi:hypothetical protein